MAKSFFEYFKENMDALGLPAPNSLFATQAAATSTASAILNAIKTLGGILRLVNLSLQGRN
ncbi:hypothetical protein DR864_28645 (plasmid) [Runella rosea]|uniref:Uncharacterized protein n=1 Tax=Runella rosea TaxID=2259595 RepID=A0A344TT71_9BACT|nr:hypothetical protein [Runella rosea]AXE21842.1 hypothetical protein DR864_28645 [Runella rosea]